MNPESGLPNSPNGVLKLFPSTSDEVNRFANRLIQSVKHEGENPLEILVQIRAMEKAFKIVTEKIQENLLTEAGKYPESKFEFMGNFIEKSEVGTSYNYEVCGDHDWEQFSVAEKTAADARKNRETFLRTIKEPLNMYDPDSGETWTVNPPVKRSSSGLKVFLK
jgi:hypothetical protein